MAERPPTFRLPRERDGGLLGWIGARALEIWLSLLWATLLAAREIDAPSAPLVALTVVLPHLGLGLILAAFIVWTGAPDRRTPPLVLAASALTVLVLWAPGWASNAEVEEGPPLRVVSWNVQRLWGKHPDPKGCIAAALAPLDAHAVVFLEISEGEAQDLAKRLGMSCTHAPYGAADNRRSSGLATCVRPPWRIRSSAPQRYVDGDNWQYLRTELANGETVVNLLAVHLTPYRATEAMLEGGWEGAWRALTSGEPVAESQGRQSQALVEHLQTLSDPTIVAGDFNSTRDAAIHARLRDHLRDAWEVAGTGFGATVAVGDQLPLRIDHVYVSDRLAVADAQVPQTDCSDHKPVSISLTVRSAP